MKLAAIDAETQPIESRPDYPPRAVGYAVRHGRTRKYLAFGHPTSNNCTRSEAVQYVKGVLREHTPVFHNADFDLEVMEKDGIKVRGEYHDTLKQAFLNEPRSFDLGLKPQAEKFLGDEPEERDFLKQWILDNIPGAKKRKGSWGDYICQAPGSIVSPYAIGDVDRTMNLHKYFSEEIMGAGMQEAYAREMKLIPITRKMEQGGIKVRLAKLKREVGAYRRLRSDLERSIQRRIGVKDLNIGSPKQLADALISKDLLSAIVRTAPSERFPNGQVSTKRAVLEQNCTDRKLVELMSLHGVLETYIGTFLERWIELGEANDGYIQPSFNTTRSSDEYAGKGRGVGTRTGRFSSSDPNLQNIPKNADDSPHKSTLLKLRKALAKYDVDFIGLRDYFCPDDGCVFIRRDYNQQELRILAHYDYDEELRRAGVFLQMYMDNPRMDAHDAVKALVFAATGMDFPRTYIKQTNFGILYGMGLLKLALRLGLERNEARKLKDAVMKAIPGIKAQMQYLKRLAKDDEPFSTWGGRRYYCEEPAYVDTDDGGRIKMTFEYKMLNTRIQGSAADCTKEGMINVDNNMRHGRLVLQVHDELVASVPKQHAKKEMIRMKEGIEDVDFRVPMLSDGEIGAVSWARMRKVA